MSKYAQLENLHNKKRDLEKEISSTMDDAFPVGSKVEVLLTSNQITPTHGTVVGHCGLAVRVRCDNTRKQSVKSVFYSDIVKGGAG